jgi:hypothetical protein
MTIYWNKSYVIMVILFLKLSCCAFTFPLKGSTLHLLFGISQVSATLLFPLSHWRRDKDYLDRIPWYSLSWSDNQEGYEATES